MNDTHTPRRDALISDFGGVLTSPLFEAFTATTTASDFSLEALGKAMAVATERHGAHPLFELETGRITEREFSAQLGEALSEELGRPVSLDDFGERLFAHLHPNEELFAYYRTLRERGIALAICTNNVREWEPRWRPLLPVDEIFDVVVDSGFVGVRKPDPEIYRLTLERLGRPAERAVFVDDLAENVEAANSLGLWGIRFSTTSGTIAAIDDALFGSGDGRA